MNPPNPYAKPARIMFILTWVLVFILLIVFFNYSQHSGYSNVVVEHNRIVINADKQGHYKIMGSLDNLNVTFLIDTGATSVAIPQAIAKKLNLVKRYPVQISTANGRVRAYLTRVNRVKLGSIEMRNVKAVILPDKNADYVLMGMNVLKELDMTIRDNQLIIERSSLSQ